jgi:hypothetical protein
MREEIAARWTWAYGCKKKYERSNYGQLAPLFRAANVGVCVREQILGASRAAEATGSPRRLEQAWPAACSLAAPMPHTAAAAAPATVPSAPPPKQRPTVLSALDGRSMNCVLLNWVLLHILLLTGAILVGIHAKATFGLVICTCLFFPLLVATVGYLRYNAAINGYRVQILAACTMIIANLWQCNFARQLPPQTSFSLGPVGNALLIGFSNMGVHTYEFHWVVKTIFAFGKLISSVIRPVWGIGDRNEVILMATCTLIGHACGYAIALNKRRLREEQASVVEMPAANRRADSRLNHVRVFDHLI